MTSLTPLLGWDKCEDRAKQGGPTDSSRADRFLIIGYRTVRAERDEEREKLTRDHSL
ncbi:hypothetical protein CROQUDRAFT_94696 [Cronartium quercuum f. sp. fusiforme G11]|uniref:Uncharacterized protein n=1 Tax=Cronartium quercuum f. sp. fusiforme G11 TaxID=708437 RepID=A0A9P6TA35_9BASI|nr:hypothetical protein CROQUDRAFT_94696 [Cronartium quercuum f. sp. fusiforme G11]